MLTLDDVKSGFFEIEEIETQWSRKIYPFKSKIYAETLTQSDFGQLGSFEFFELNTTSHQYMFTTFVDISSPHASILYP